MALGFFDSGYGVWNLELPRVGRSARRAGSLPPLGVPPLLLLYRSDPGSFSPSGFRRRPRWGQLKPSGALPVGGDFIAQQETPVKGAAHGFAATPLTGISRCAFCESPTEQIAQRACSRHEPTRWGEAAKREPRKGALIYHFVSSCGASSVPSESAIQPFANLAICKRSIAPKVFSPFEALASIGKMVPHRQNGVVSFTPAC